MDSTHASQFRPHLQENVPNFVSRLRNPWEQVPDLESLNHTAYGTIKQLLQRLYHVGDRTPGSRGIALLGPEGSGKSHILMRMARDLWPFMSLCNVRRPNHEDSVALHIWGCLLDSLTQRPADAPFARTALDELVARVLQQVLISASEWNVASERTGILPSRWTKAIKATAVNVLTLAAGAGKYSVELSAVRAIALDHLMVRHPEADRMMLHALLSYGFSSMIRSEQPCSLGWQATKSTRPRCSSPPPHIPNALRQCAPTDMSMKLQRETKAASHPDDRPPLHVPPANHHRVRRARRVGQAGDPHRQLGEDRRHNSGDNARRAGNNQRLSRAVELLLRSTTGQRCPLPYRGTNGPTGCVGRVRRTTASGGTSETHRRHPATSHDDLPVHRFRPE